MLRVCNAAALPPLQTGEKLGYCQGREPWYEHTALLMHEKQGAVAPASHREPS